MLEVIEGNDPLPALAPAVRARAVRHGTAGRLGGGRRPAGGSRASPNPTLVNNVETLSNVPAHPRQRRRLVPFDGHGRVARHRSWPRSSATSWRPTSARSSSARRCAAVIDAVGSGVPPGRAVKAVFSGVANPVVTADDLDVPVSYEGFSAIGSGMGAAGFIVYDDTACMVDAAYRCRGSCTSSRAGSARRARSVRARSPRCSSGSRPGRRGHRHRQDPGWLDRVTDGNRCYLGDRGAARRRQHPARVPRRVRRAHRAPRLPATRTATDPEVARPGERRRHLRRAVLVASNRTGPTPTRKTVSGHLTWGQRIDPVGAWHPSRLTELVAVLGAWHQALAHRPVSGTQFSNGSAADDSACQTPILLMRSDASWRGLELGDVLRRALDHHPGVVGRPAERDERDL